MEITLHRLFVSRHSHFVVAKVNKVCYYVLARNRIALTQDFSSWAWDFVNFLNHCGYCSTNRSHCQAVCVNFLYFCILHKNGVFVLSFYNKYIRLCTEKGISPSAAAIEIGIRKSNVTYWKSNRNNPSDATLQKIADYFGVTVEYLKSEETKNAPMPNDIGEENILRMYRSLSTEEKGALYTYALSLKEKQKEGK
nr:MAG TPA: Repressor protein CI [Caudoviricetes sp.]